MTHKQNTKHPKRALKPVKVKRVAASDFATPAVDKTAQMYARAIEITTSSQFDPRKIAIALAQVDPGLFIKLFETTTVVPSWQREVVALTYGSQIVSAIKLIRERTGLGLKEAKDVADNLRLHMSKNGYMIDPARIMMPSPLNPTTEPVFKELATAANNAR